MADVELRNVSRQFEGAPSRAVDDLSLHVASGEFLVLVGPSGCGKSTALRMIAGLEDPDDGQISIGGRPMNRVAPQDRDVAMVFQGYALYPHMKVREIMGFPLKMRKVPAAQREQKVKEAADMLSITRLLDRRPDELSGGERQRVAMGRALVRSPKVFLFDEPLSNLDAALRGEIRVEIGSLVRKLGATTVYVTHDHVEAMTLGHRIAVMRGGKLIQLGTPREVYEHPATAFVASFLGAPAMNLTSATRENDHLTVHGIRLRCLGDSPKRLLLGIRPEHVKVHGPVPDGNLRVEAIVTTVEPLGAETFVHLDAGGAALRARLPGFDAPSVGEPIVAHFPPDCVHLFQAEESQHRVSMKVEAA
ncbi:MAG TPA: sn-glycerol-3-phosphate ABC transporter ATP-binding protein UgpC [Polyangiaceae bacterium]|nr:MAG: sn-glycerol-3-phosphate import ATP-binding protein UgpC [Deltaproteobacteria bacterium ADurb.Bin207]HNZ20969.1 sn-glycerol-3-phosphate ABC transporter ATP-binding protein UgpC [Polyangiaceae bacterium]HOD23882.1 sn-glycerol-3-phosphate ABC transporter ATP-binding protein UgpC [Polyangiaceae bacterium]HOG98839.1 sn-glycerol-3-phosphate ABC transporter ATP-binding protein UgpC [Polyangiaceae bacterium]HOR36939.1 sn-glycerol-3-phosphate ABC transporter ATP-binding protein UgpC [Polyangiace